jgi:hypothetical protein
MASVLAWGARGREFESHHSDQKREVDKNNQPLFFYADGWRVPTWVGKVLREFIPGNSGSLTILTGKSRNTALFVCKTYKRRPIEYILKPKPEFVNFSIFTP